MDNLFFTAVGVVLPLLCIFGFLALLVGGIRNKKVGKPYGRTFTMAMVLLLLFIAVMGSFFLFGALGIGPVPN